MKREIIVKKDEKKVIPVIWTGDEAEMNYSISLAGQGADATLLMLLLGDEDKTAAVNTTVLHQKPDTVSRVIVKGALRDKSRVDFEGLVKVERGAKRSNAWLASHILLLSDQSGGRAVPNLEIDENDVKAGHAATVGKVNELELFYLMSRGISKEAATNLIVQGFLQSLLNEFPSAVGKKARKELKWI
jgi:Fe-S cluster assembly protein SufD